MMLMTLRMKRHRSGAAKSRSKYSAVKIATQAVSRQKKTILYLSPQESVPARPGRCPHGTKSCGEEQKGWSTGRSGKVLNRCGLTCFDDISHDGDSNEKSSHIVKHQRWGWCVGILECSPHFFSEVC